jgi:hypothetical protein
MSVPWLTLRMRVAAFMTWVFQDGHGVSKWIDEETSNKKTKQLAGIYPN